jgi:hypothetical protein
VHFVIGPFARIIVAANPSILVADETSASVISATMVGAGGHVITETRTVVFSTTLGIISPLTRTTSTGVATATLQTTTTVGTAVVTAWADGVVGQTNVIFAPEKFYVHLPLVVRNSGSALD